MLRFVNISPETLRLVSDNRQNDRFSESAYHKPPEPAPVIECTYSSTKPPNCDRNEVVCGQQHSFYSFIYYIN